MLEVLAAILGIGILVLAYIAYQKNAEALESRNDSRSYQADATVQRARATKYKKVLEEWGGNIEELEKQLEVAGGNQVGPAVVRFRDRLAKLRLRGQGSGGGETGGKG